MRTLLRWLAHTFDRLNGSAPMPSLERAPGISASDYDQLQRSMVR